MNADELARACAVGMRMPPEPLTPAEREELRRREAAATWQLWIIPVLAEADISGNSSEKVEVKPWEEVRTSLLRGKAPGAILLRVLHNGEDVDLHLRWEEVEGVRDGGTVGVEFFHLRPATEIEIGCSDTSPLFQSTRQGRGVRVPPPLRRP